MSFFRRNDVTAHPHYHFMVGRLAGAAEMAAILMMDSHKHESVDMVAVGSRLDVLARWFVEPDQGPELPALPHRTE